MQNRHATRRGPGLVGVWWPAAVAAVVAVMATLILVFQPLGTPEAGTAALDAFEREPASATAAVLAQQRWGDGIIVLTGSDDDQGNRHLALAFVIDRGRGWRVTGRTEDQVDLADVVVGSLLVASSPGGSGQPAWSAVYGEVSDERIGQADVEWSDGERMAAALAGRAYLIIRPGEHTALFVRYLGEDDDEIAVVPVETP